MKTHNTVTVRFTILGSPNGRDIVALNDDEELFPLTKLPQHIEGVLIDRSSTFVDRDEVKSSRLTGFAGFKDWNAVDRYVSWLKYVVTLSDNAWDRTSNIELIERICKLRGLCETMDWAYFFEVTQHAPEVT